MLGHSTLVRFDESERNGFCLFFFLCFVDRIDDMAGDEGYHGLSVLIDRSN